VHCDGQHPEQARLLLSAGFRIAEMLVSVGSKYWKCFIKEEEWRS